MKKILGFKKFVSKKGLPICCVCCVSEFGEAEVNSSTECAGSKVENVMMFGDDGNIINKGCIGKELTGFFGYQNGMTLVQGAAIK